MERTTQMWMVGGFIIVMLGVVIAAAVFSGGVQTTTAKFDATQAAPITADDHVKGNSPVSVIEYGDFQCPACGAWEPIVEELEAKYAGKVQFVFRNFPLVQAHPNAMISAQAAEAANLQGKYWEMHDLLYQKQQEWSSAQPADVVKTYFDGYVKSLGMDVAKFDKDINSDAVVARVQRDITSGNEAKVDHTPSFFVNLAQIKNPSDLNAFAAVLDAELASSTAPTGTATTTR